MHSETFMVLSKCFAPLSKDSWEELVSSEWDSFLEALATDLPDDKMPKSTLEILANPPSYEEKHAFAARHFTGGLPVSAMPIESLYVDEEADRTPEYYREPALYMKDLLKSLGYAIPKEYETYPDHIVIELEVLALLLDSDKEGARDFALTRFYWIPKFKNKINAFGKESAFYMAAIDALDALICSMH